MNAIESFKQGGCYVCPQSLHELALLMDWLDVMPVSGEHIVGNVCFIVYGYAHFLLPTYEKYGKNITEEFFEEVCGV